MKHYNKRSRTPLDRHKKKSAAARQKAAKEDVQVQKPAAEEAPRTEAKTPEKAKISNPAKTEAAVKAEKPEVREIKTEEKKPAAKEQKNTENRPAVKEQKPAAEEQRPVRKEQKPAVKEEAPVSKEQKKAIRAKLKLDEIDRLASIPRASILQTLFRPARAMERLSDSEDPTLSQFACLFLSLAKWIVFGFVPAALTARIINSDPLTYGHMNFTAQGTMALVIGLFMTFAEYYLMACYYLFCRIIREEMSLRALISVHARGALQLIVLYLFAALFLKGSLWIGTAFWAGVTMYNFLLSGYAFDLEVPVPKTMQLAVFLVVTFFMVLCSGIFFQLTLKNAAGVFGMLLKL